MIITTKPLSKKQRSEQEIILLQQQKKTTPHAAKQLERNYRKHRIFTRDNLLEHFMQHSLLVTDNQVYLLLQAVFSTEAVQTIEKALITEATQAVTQASVDTECDTET